MQFETGYLYHIYNQGNNRQKIFFKQENYLFFLRKMHTHILPYADVLAWCLMPNHFHFMIRVNHLAINKGGIECKFVNSSDDFKSSGESEGKPCTLNQSIAIMLRSYTRAIQKQEVISGSLSRQKTKAECLNGSSGITPAFFNTNFGTIINVDFPEKHYPQVCFNYIHQNPVKARMVKNITDWEFSSAKEYAGLRNGTLVNKKLAREFVDTTIFHSG